jgi:hypothetical protein
MQRMSSHFFSVSAFATIFACGRRRRTSVSTICRCSSNDVSIFLFTFFNIFDDTFSRQLGP